MSSVKHRNGIKIDGEIDISLDSASEGDELCFISHAHADHALKKDSGNIVCSDLTERITEKRFDIDIERTQTVDIEQIPSGHIIGSTAALIQDKILYTGDVSLRDRVYLDGFEPVRADELVIESTYGIPKYRFPDQKQIEQRIKDWIQDSQEPLFLFAYSLGKAQKIQQLVQEATERPIIAHGAVKKMNEVIEDQTSLEFRAKNYKDNRDLMEENGIMIAPSRSAKAEYIENMVEKYSGSKAGFSGWAVDESFRYRGGYDRTFPFSDHCDFDELLEVVEKVDPEKVYTHHGFDEAFASYLQKEKGIDARALKNNQSSLADF